MVGASLASALLSLAVVVGIFGVFAWIGERIDDWEAKHSARGEVGNGSPYPSRTEDQSVRRDPRAEHPEVAA